MSRLTAKQSADARQIARRERAEPVIENLSNIPSRDTLDAHGRLSEGLDRRKLKYRDLSNDELGSASVDDRTIQGRLGASSVPTLTNIEGNLPDGKLPNIGANKLPGDVQYGTPKAAGISWADGKDFVPGDAIKGLDWAKIGGTPSFAKQGDIDSAATSVKSWVKKNYRPK